MRIDRKEMMANALEFLSWKGTNLLDAYFHIGNRLRGKKGSNEPK